MMTEWFTSNSLVGMTDSTTKEKATLTLKLDRETLAELKAAAKIIGATSYSSLVHQQIMLKIREAKQMVTKEDFDKTCAEQMEDIKTRSKVKAEERRKSKANMIGEEVIENFDAKKLPKKKGKKGSEKIITSDGETLPYLEEDDFSDQ